MEKRSSAKGMVPRALLHSMRYRSHLRTATKHSILQCTAVLLLLQCIPCELWVGMRLLQSTPKVQKLLKRMKEQFQKLLQSTPWFDNCLPLPTKIPEELHRQFHKLLAKKRNVQGKTEKELPPTPEQKAPTQKMSQAEELSGPIATAHCLQHASTGHCYRACVWRILSPCYRAWLACSRRKSGTLHVNEDQ